MPREHGSPRREKSDNRPAFARPPAQVRVSQSPASDYISSSQQRQSRSTPHHRRSRTREVEIEEEVDGDESELESEQEDVRGLPQRPERVQHSSRDRRRDAPKAKSSPAPSPRKDENRRHRTSKDYIPSREVDRDHHRESRNRESDRDAEQRRQQRHKRKISAAVQHSPRTERELDHARDRAKYNSGTSTNSTSQLLSADSLAKLNAVNNRRENDEDREQQAKDRRKHREIKEKQYQNLKVPDLSEKRKRKKNRDVSGAILEEGRATGRSKRRKHDERGHDDRYDDLEEDIWDEKRRTRKTAGLVGGGGGGGGDGGGGGIFSKLPSFGWRNWSKRRKFLIILGALAVVLIIIIAGAVAASKNKSNGGASGSSGSSGASVSNQCDTSAVPAVAKGTYTDISLWMDTTDFNCTYTAETIGNLSIMGLKSSWDDSKQANGNVPALNQQWQYGKMPIRGTNLGGWLNLEPFITPSLFAYAASDNVVDEYTLSQKLGNSASRLLENHYATFITKQDFTDIASAGLDHVRIPYPYWAVRTYDGDPYVPQIAWRYLLRGIEYARENGLRVNLDLHSAPGSQNGWAHSGHQGSINWLMGTNGQINAQRTLDIHDSLSKFFAQDRYKNVVTIYGLINEPKMLVIDHASVLDWNKKAIALIRGNGIKQNIVFGDGFLALDDWDNMFKNVDSNLVMDTHQYQIFNVGQLKLKHQDKINLACTGWSGMLAAVNNPQSGWGPTLNGEWSQADTDCTPNLNNVGVGSRWAGTLNFASGGDAYTSISSVTTPTCASSPSCSCDIPNGDPNRYPESYKRFLKMFAEAQMYAFEQAWGWFYWTWKTENAVQWSWKLGLKAGILPAKAYQPSFRCDSQVPSFADLSESI